jgi:hypothetical protein
VRIRVALLAVLWAMWLIVAVVAGERIVRDAVDYRFLRNSCTLPHQDSLKGTASWHWWPPGEVCQDDAGRVFRRPLAWRKPAIVTIGIGFVLLSGATMALARRDPSRDERDDIDIEQLTAGRTD